MKRSDFVEAGRKGGKIAASRMTAKERTERARKAGKARQHGLRYLSRTPVSVGVLLGSGRVLVHNHVTPQAVLNMNGFRAWTQPPDNTLEICPCDWAGVTIPVKVHYRGKRVDSQ